jgi:hypothetical protein
MRFQEITKPNALTISSSYPKCGSRFWTDQSDTLVNFWLVLFLDQILARFWLILAIFLAVVCNSIHPLASIPAFAMPEAKDQVQNLTFTSGSTIYPSSITSDSAPQSDSYPAATISSSTASILLPQPPHRHRPISAYAPNLAFCSTLRHPPPQ